MLWITLIAATLCTSLGILCGRRVGAAHHWLTASGVCAAILVTIFAGHRSVRLSFIPPISWLVNPYLGPPLAAFALTTLLTCITSRLPSPRTRKLLTVLSVVLIFYAALWPLAAALIARPSLATIQTQIDPNGVCLQSRTYTCGPASAVSCLHALGVTADEGQLAIAAQCRQPEGIEGPLLASAITQLHGGAGVSAEYRWIGSTDKLPVPAVACMKTGSGHDVAVLAITPGWVWIGDPLTGGYYLTRAEFAAAWTGAAVVLHRTSE